MNSITYMDKKWGKPLAFIVLTILLTAFSLPVYADTPGNPIGVAGQVRYNGDLIGSGVHVTIEWMEEGYYYNTTTNDGNFAKSISGMKDGDTVQVNVSYQGKNVFNTTIVDTSLVTNWCNISIYASGGGSDPVIVLPDAFEAMEGDVVSFDASDCYDPDGNIVDYMWSFHGDGNPYTLNGKTVTKKWMDDIECLVYLTVTDNDGNTTMIRRNIIIANSPPHAVVDGSSSVSVGDTLSLTANGSSDAGNDALYYRWDVDEDGIWDTDYDALEDITLTFDMVGTYNITLKVSDGDGGTDTETHMVTVEENGNGDNDDDDDDNETDNEEPIANFSISGTQNTDGSYKEGSILYLESTSVDPDGEIINWTWNMAGYIAYGETVSYTLDMNGNRTIRLTIMDDNASTDYITKEITIKEKVGSGNSTLTITFPDDDIQYSVENTENEEIIYSGIGDGIISIENLDDGTYIIHCAKGDKTWQEIVDVHGYSTHEVDVPSSSSGGLPIGFEVIPLGFTIAIFIFMMRRKKRYE